MLIITEMSYFWRLVGVESLGANPIDHLPITVCGWAVIFCSNLVLSKGLLNKKRERDRILKDN